MGLLASLPLMSWSGYFSPYEVPKTWMVIVLSGLSVILAIFNSQPTEKTKYHGWLLAMVGMLWGWLLVSSVLAGEFWQSWWGNPYRGDGLLTLLSMIVLGISVTINPSWWRWVAGFNLLISAWVLINGQPDVALTMGNPNMLAGYLAVTLPFFLFLPKRYQWVGILPILAIGFLSGFGFGLQNLYLPFGGLMLVLIIIFSRRKLIFVPTYLFGTILGNLPMVVFDLRHDFYHLRTLWQYFLDVYVTHTVSGFTDYYHFLYLFPYLFLFFAFVTINLSKIFKPLALAPLLLFVYYSFTSPKFDLNHSTGMPPGITTQSLETAAGLIAKDKPSGKFNVATLWDFDTRANPLRYLLKYYYHLIPEGYENYADVDTLYVFAPDSYDIVKPRVWELTAFLPYRISDLGMNSPGYRLYKLSK